MKKEPKIDVTKVRAKEIKQQIKIFEQVTKKSTKIKIALEKTIVITKESLAVYTRDLKQVNTYIKKAEQAIKVLNKELSKW